MARAFKDSTIHHCYRPVLGGRLETWHIVMSTTVMEVSCGNYLSSDMGSDGSPPRQTHLRHYGTAVS